MKNKWKMNRFQDMRPFLMLALTQGLSALGSAMTSFALVVWSYSQTGSALSTALLSVCSYAPYVMMSIFAGALSDRWDKRRTMLVCDVLAAATTLGVFALLEMGWLEIGHLYAINAINGLMNTVQRPASDVAVTLLTPRQRYQQAAAVRSMMNSVVDLLSPVLATAVLAAAGLRAVLLVDLATFALAFASLLLLIRLPDAPKDVQKKETLLESAGAGVTYLREHRGVLHMILAFAAVNMVASMYNAALPAMVLSVPGGGEAALAAISTVTGVATLLGGAIAAMLPKPKSRVTMVLLPLCLSLGTENFLLAFGRTLPVWCFGAVLGWIAIPTMNANLDALLRGYIPLQIQGRVFACRNTLQFFTIPLGYAVGGWLVDAVFEPMMAAQGAGSWLVRLFGSGKGSGASALFAVIALCGVMVCMAMARDRAIRELEKE